MVIGSGVAGLKYALSVAEHGSVAVVTKSAARESNTNYAQVRDRLSFTQKSCQEGCPIGLCSNLKYACIQSCLCLSQDKCSIVVVSHVPDIRHALLSHMYLTYVMHESGGKSR